MSADGNEGTSTHYSNSDSKNVGGVRRFLYVFNAEMFTLYLRCWFFQQFAISVIISGRYMQLETNIVCGNYCLRSGFSQGEGDGRQILFLVNIHSS